MESFGECWPLYEEALVPLLESFVCWVYLKTGFEEGYILCLYLLKDTVYWYRDSHYEPDAFARQSEVYNGNPYVRKIAPF